MFHHFLLQQHASSAQHASSTAPSFDYKNVPIAKLSTTTTTTDENDDEDELHVHLVPFLNDNYAYVIYCPRTQRAIAIDPADPTRVHQFLQHQYQKLSNHNNQQQLQQQNTMNDENSSTTRNKNDQQKEEDNNLTNSSIELTHILTTHRHADHAGGNKMLKQWFPQVEVIGAENEKVPAVTRTVRDGQVLEIEMSENCVLRVDCISTPCHTKGHMVFVVRRMLRRRNSQSQSKHGQEEEEEEESSGEVGQIGPALVFTGDHVFIGGCGAFFEGSPQNMYASTEKLKRRINELFPGYGESNKDNVLVLCGHEYTLMCLYAIVRRVPTNLAAKIKYRWATERRMRGQPTVPSPWYDELQYNPYLRTDSEELRRLFNCDDPVRIMHLLYEMAKAAVTSGGN